MSVAIIPMAHQFGWNATVSGLVQSAFFYGYMLCQLPGGYLSTRFSGSRMLPIGVGLWSLATFGLPAVGGSVPGLCASRSLVGLGEALAPAAVADVVAKTIPPQERSRAVSFVNSGLYVGTILGKMGHVSWTEENSCASSRTANIADADQCLWLAIGVLRLWRDWTGLGRGLGNAGRRIEAFRYRNL